MKRRAGIIGAAALGLAIHAHAFSSPYSGMAVPGSHNSWDSAPSMVLVADNVWICTQTLDSASGTFKFVADGTWTKQWGGATFVYRVPAEAFAPVTTGDPDPLNYSGLTPGDYRFTFNDFTKKFTLEWAGASPLPLPAITNLSIVGTFNGWTNNPNSQMTNHPAPHTNLWSGTVVLDNSTSFQFQPNNNSADLWGAPLAGTIVPPVGGVACGHSDYTLAGFSPGEFLFTLDISNNTFAVTQTVAYVFDAMTVQGSFIGTNNPPANMAKISGTTRWESDHHITNATSVTLRFSAGTNFIWGPTNGTPTQSLPAFGTMIRSTNFASVNLGQPGRYRITFNHLTGDYSFQRLYVDNSLGTNNNLLKNPGFERTTESTGGLAIDWGSWQAYPHNVANFAAAPHSGSWCGAIHGKYFSNWTDYGSFAQDVPVVSGRTYRASAWFRATPNWSATTMQIKIEWQNAASVTVSEASVNISALTNHWTKYSVEATAPTNAVQAHVVFLCAGANVEGSIMYVDDVEMRVMAGRTQNFDTWGQLVSFGPYSPDWAVTSGKVVWNQAPPPPPIEVFISQYVEGSGNNKAIEIYNGLTTNLDLAAQNYVLQQYDNGATTPSVSIPLTGVVAPGQTLVVGRPNSPPLYAPTNAISGLPNLFTNKYLTFNGDDAIVLRQGGTNGTVKDRVGQVGANATGSMWSRNTRDRTLKRNSTILTGTVGLVTAPFPLEDWSVSASDDFSGLGEHTVSFIDGDEPYTPAGYSLTMNTNAVLMSGELPGGIGDVGFWWRTESMSPGVTMSLESAPTETGPWVTNGTLTNVTRRYFTNHVVSVNRADHLFWRIRQIGGGTNRFRIDEIEATEYATIRRLEDFNSWIDAAYTLPGTYSRYGWTISASSISSTGGVNGTRAALLSPTNSAVISPAFESGVGEVVFWAETANEGKSAFLRLEVSTDGGTNWLTQRSFTVTTGATHTTWLYFTNVGAQARIAFDPAMSSDDVFVDDVEVRLPALYRNQNFNGWPLRNSYTNDTYQGWIISNCMVNASNAYEGQSARLNKTLGSHIRSPYLPGGIGTIGFLSRRWATGDAIGLDVQISADAANWTTVATVAPTSTVYQPFSMYVGSTNHFYVRIYHASGAFLSMVDEISCGVYQPRPQVVVTPGLNPAAPIIQEPTTVIADVLTRYGASILSVTSSYRVATNSWVTNGMIALSPGSYASTSAIPGQTTGGIMIRYAVTVRYAGLGADPGSSGYGTNVYTTSVYTNWVATVRPGDIWINEIFYAPYGLLEPWWIDWDTYEYHEPGECHEFIELCGVEGVDLGGWTIQLAFGAPGDIALNSNTPVYASYTIPPGAMFTNAASGYGFYVLGDSDLATNAPIDQYLTQAISRYVPFVAQPQCTNDHIYNGVGVVRLLDQYGNEFYSLSYEGFASGSDRIFQSQASMNETNSISLTYQGGSYGDFEWEMGIPTAGSANSGQVLIPRTPETNVYAWAWHTQDQRIVPANTNLVSPFYMLDPWPPAHYDNVPVYAGYNVADSYASAAGTLYHRGSGGWSTLGMSIRDGAGDSAGHGFVWATIPHHTYERLQTIQYVVEFRPNKPGVLNAYLGSGPGSNNISTVYTNLAAAQTSPFTYTIPIADQIYVTNALFAATNVTLWTEGNDPDDPLENFYIRTGTNLQTPIALWGYTNFTGATNIYGQWTFNVRRTTNAAGRLFYAIQPLWP